MTAAVPAEPGSARRSNALLLILLPVLLAAGLVTLIGEPASALLRYERQAVLSGQVWRLFTAHLVHLGWAHLALNAAALVLIALLFGRLFGATAWTALAVIAALGVGLGLIALRADIRWYVGLSGLAHGLIAASALALLHTRRGAGIVLLALLAGKLLFEQSAGAPTGTQALIGGATVVDAHLFGALAGLLGALPLIRPHRRGQI